MLLGNHFYRVCRISQSGTPGNRGGGQERQETLPQSGEPTEASQPAPWGLLVPPQGSAYPPADGVVPLPGSACQASFSTITAQGPFAPGGAQRMCVPHLLQEGGQRE